MIIYSEIYDEVFDAQGRAKGMGISTCIRIEFDNRVGIEL